MKVYVCLALTVCLAAASQPPAFNTDNQSSFVKSFVSVFGGSHNNVDKCEFDDERIGRDVEDILGSITDTSMEGLSIILSSFNDLRDAIKDTSSTCADAKAPIKKLKQRKNMDTLIERVVKNVASNPANIKSILHQAQLNFQEGKFKDSGKSLGDAFAAVTD